jgi:TatD DNase family protein
MFSNNVPLVDSHCHLDFPGLIEHTPGVLERMAGNGVSHALCVSVSLEDFPKVLGLAKAHRNLYASAGVHPDHETGAEATVQTLCDLADNSRVIAIGETGLDYYRLGGDLEWQRARFRTHIRAARALKKPLIIHCRQAAGDLLGILRDERAQDVGGVMHCFTESWEVASAAMDMGFYISFSGIVTFRNASALRDVCARVPEERLLVETDSPYLAPVPYRGKTNEPAYVRFVAECVANVRGSAFEAVAEATTRNFFRLFSPPEEHGA